MKKILFAVAFAEGIEIKEAIVEVKENGTRIYRIIFTNEEGIDCEFLFNEKGRMIK